MVLYKKVFPLGKEISFFQYITTIRKSYFPNFVVTVDKIPSTENYLAQVFFTAPLWRWGVANWFRDGVFLRKCTIQPFKDEDYFILEGSPRTWNLLAAFMYVIVAFLFLSFVLFTIITTGIFTRDLFFLVLFTVAWLTPLILIYFRDKRFLDKIGSLAIELKQDRGN
jgi:hypothetical protein